MHLKGAKIRNFYYLCSDMQKDDQEEPYPLRVNIPHYQRPFKWGNKKITLLINDFFDNYNNTIINNSQNTNEPKNKKKYFAGSIVTVNKDNYNSYQDLIDGQQRITTIFLVNYIKFLIIRTYISQLIQSGDQLNIMGAFDDFIKTGKYLYKNGEKEIKSIKNKIIKSLKNINQDEKLTEKYIKLAKEYKEYVKLPIINLDNDEYPKTHQQNLLSFFKNKEFCLKYSRESFNNKLREALTYTRINLTNETGPELVIDDDKFKEDNTIKNYVNAIKTIFYCFNKRFIINTNKKNISSLEKVRELTKKIDCFLKYLRFCVIQTGDTNDAYTLFEVLNDRALELDDLDLIKNMFYKEYCQQNRFIEEKKIDNNIEELEKLWGDNIFNPNTSDWKKKFIAFAGTVFLTGDTRVKHSGKEKYRKFIQEYLDNEYGKTSNSYNFKNIKYEFNIFYAIKRFINIFDIPYQRKKYSALKAENEQDVSITYETCHLLNALKWNGVIASLINIILKNFIKESKSKFDIDKFISFVENLKNDYNHTNDRFTNIHKCANNLLKLALLSKNYKIPRKYAKKIIEKINYSNFDIDIIEIKSSMLENSKEEFKNWTNRWYKGNKNDFRIKLLFLKLLRGKKDNNIIKYRNSQTIFKNIEKLQLDHFEPKNPNYDNKNKYFLPDPLSKNRNDYVDQLGNFMLLDQDKNSSLSNAPADKSFKYYKDMNLGDHWIIKEMDDLLDKNSNKINEIKVPNEEFFNERKRKLQNYFYSIIKMDYDDENAQIDEIM